ncbi:MAG: GSCFA domain-containing protein [Janthinobacterium lividum]
MFRTELTIAPQERQLARTARVLTLGSCFAESIGEQLRLCKVTALVNPFGTVFQPLALAQLLRAAAGEAQDWQQHVVEARGRWQSFDLHSTIGAESPVELLQTIQETVRRVGDFVRTADVVVLTLGTAWAYRLRETGELVSNLHKLPASLFEKELLTADEIVNALAEVHALLRRMNPDVRIVLTVSPVRHIKDTLPLNAVSKSVLRVACHYLSELLPGVSYFPAYELLNDDLRDYRFYATDMLHPSEAAQEYIWERFARTYFDADFGRFRKEWAAVRQSLGHRPLHEGAPEHRQFLDQTRERLERLAGQGVEVRQELRDVQRQLAALPPPKPVRAPEPEPDDDEERIDIGDSTSEVPAIPVPVASERRSEEYRSDERRDQRRSERKGQDRRNGRNGQGRNNQPQPIAEPLVVAELATELPAEALAADLVSTPLVPTAAPEAEALAAEETSGYPAKKKKRRSRGGAKRTARKNAARLALEQDSGESPSLAEEELREEHDLETVDLDEVVVPDDASPTPPNPEPILAALPTADEAATSPTVASETPAAPRKRGTGPLPKKSKVITKSGVVKRGQRQGLYQPAPTAPDAAPETAAVVPATAPLISAPIIPELLLERPAMDLATPTPAAEPDLAATVLGLYSTKTLPTPVAAPKPRRGRPKAASAVEPMPEAAPALIPPAPVAEADVPIVAAPETLGELAAPVMKAAKTPKTAAAKKAPAKPATAKKTPAKPVAATKRGRPPGKKPTPPADAPTS